MNVKTSNISLPLKLCFLIFSMVLNCMGIIILQLSGNNISYSNLGVLEAFKDLPIAIISLFAANFISRYGTKFAMIISMLFVGVCSFLLPLIEDFWVYKVWFAIIGICFAMAKISVYSIMRNNIRNEGTLAKTMSNVEASFMIGIFVVNIGFGLIISSVYEPYWKYGFWIIALLSFINIALLKRTRIIENLNENERTSLKELSVFFTKRNVLFFLVILVIVFVEQNFNSWLPSFYKKHLNVNSFLALQATAFLALFSYIGRLVTAQIIQRFSLSCYFLTCLFLMIAVLLVAQTFVILNFSQIALFIFPLIGLFLAPLYPVISSKMISNIDKNRINIFTSLIVIFSSLGSSFGSIAMSFLFEFQYGNHYAIFILIALIALLIVSLLYFKSFVSKSENNV